MSGTMTTVVPAHTLVQQRDERGRTSSLHAALPLSGLDVGGVVPLLGSAVIWRTACGALLTDTERTPLTTWIRDEAMAVLEAPGARRCARCDRVGDAL